MNSLRRVETSHVIHFTFFIVVIVAVGRMQCKIICMCMNVLLSKLHLLLRFDFFCTFFSFSIRMWRISRTHSIKTIGVMVEFCIKFMLAHTFNGTWLKVGMPKAPSHTHWSRRSRRHTSVCVCLCVCLKAFYSKIKSSVPK